MNKIAVFFLTISLCALQTYAQGKKFSPPFSVVFDSSKGTLLLHQCSRATPRHVAEFWTPQKEDIEMLESNFFKLDTLAARTCCAVGFRVGDLEKYGFQYVGVVIKGRKCIYLNAFSLSFLDEEKKKDQHLDPAKVPLAVCDGGPSFWGVLFDTGSKEFSQLSFNGRG
jgi:hypothetical protein